MAQPERVAGTVEQPGATFAERMAKLRRFNRWIGLLHLGQGTAVAILSTDFSLPVNASYLALNDATGRVEPLTRTLFEVPVAALVAAFLFLSAIAHFVIASPAMADRYDGWVARGVNPARWVEYSASASLMIVVIAMLTGIYDMAALVALFAVNASMILFGWMMERHNLATERTHWMAFWFGSAVGIVPWVVIGAYLAGAGDPPGFVYGIYASLFVFFNVFAVNMALRYRGRGRWRDPMVAERGYVWLSLIAKSLLAWQVFAGTLRPV